MSIVVKFEAFLLTEKRVAANTLSAYSRDLEQFVAFVHKKGDQLEQITTQVVKEFLGYLKGQGIGARSMARKISALKVFIMYAKEQGLFATFCLDEIILPKLERKLPSFMSEQEIKALLQVAERDTSPLGLRNKAMLYLLYTSGMRISELINLKISDFHPDTAFLRVYGKGGKERMVPLPECMTHLLKEYVQNVFPHFTQNGKRKTDYFFPIYYGGVLKPITRQAFWILLKNLWKQTGIQRSISPHVLRHSLATHLLKNGMDLRSLQLILGHENLATVQIYTHVETSHVRGIYDKKHPRS